MIVRFPFPASLLHCVDLKKKAKRTASLRVLSKNSPVLKKTNGKRKGFQQTIGARRKWHRDEFFFYFLAFGS